MHNMVENAQHNNTAICNSLVYRSDLHLPEQLAQDIAVAVVACGCVAYDVHDGDVLSVRVEEDVVRGDFVSTVDA